MSGGVGFESVPYLPEVVSEEGFGEGGVVYAYAFADEA